jgi:hypothetical protein
MNACIPVINASLSNLAISGAIDPLNAVAVAVNSVATTCLNEPQQGISDAFFVASVVVASSLVLRVPFFAREVLLFFEELGQDFS